MGTAKYKIGRVASRLGVSVRTLRHYDEIGLLRPASRTTTGHRLYADSDLDRLKKIVALRKMGFSLSHIRSVLSGDTTEAYRTLEAQATRLREQISQQQGVLKSVEAVLDHQDMYTQFSKEELRPAKQRSAEIFAALKQEMELGTDPKDARVQHLIRDMETTGKELMERVGGREKTLERMENFKRYRPLIPEAGQARIDEMKAKMKPFQENMKKLAEYLRRAKA
jgi:DNA-binding transcriptional MerR regulator